MTDDIARLRAALRKEGPVTPRKVARDFAIDRAVTVYDEKYPLASKGNGFGDRLRVTALAVYQTLVGRRSMKTTPALVGGASLSVLLLAVLGTSYWMSNIGNNLLTDVGHYAPANEQAPLIRAPTAPWKESDEHAQVGADEAREPTVMTQAPAIASRNELADIATAAPVAKNRRNSAPIAGPSEPTVAPVAPLPRMQPSAAAQATHSNGEGVATLAAPLEAESQAAGARATLRAFDDVRPTIGYYHDQGRDEFATITPNPVKLASEEPLSTFSIDVDTASYAFLRASLNNNVLPQKDAVRTEELINYFPYDYPGPDDPATPFKASVSVFPSPWNVDNKLIHIGIKGYELPHNNQPASNLVFLLDTSGSMNEPNKLPLARNAMKLLLESLKPDDTVAIVTYAGSAGTVLEPTPVEEKAKILGALDNLHSGGSTAGAEGIRQAYLLAGQHFRKDGVNRVILATDGDFNVGITDDDELKSYIERQRKTGIYLSVLGFGMGNYNDALMQTLAQNGNGNAAYIDSLNEARKVLVEEASSTLFTIAKDVKIQVEFNPAAVSEYRLVGYETRILNKEDFNNDKVDAGEIGSGHTVTAIYEITPRGGAGQLVDDLRYGDRDTVSATESDITNDEYAFLKIRYKLPDEETSKLITAPITRELESQTTGAAPTEARFATAVAAFGQLLRGGRYTGSYSFDDVINLAQGAKGHDQFGYRAEFINLVRLARSAAALQPLGPNR